MVHKKSNFGVADKSIQNKETVPIHILGGTQADLTAIELMGKEATQQGNEKKE
jgi:hypothetical protein